MSTITDTTRQCRKITIQVLSRNFSVLSAINKVLLSKTTTNSFTTTTTALERISCHVGDRRERSTTHRRKLRKSIRLLKNILIISTSQVLSPRLHRHLLPNITALMTSRVFFLRSLSSTLAKS